MIWYEEDQGAIRKALACEMRQMGSGAYPFLDHVPQWVKLFWLTVAKELDNV
jgi:hypothetical protein